MTVFTAFFTLVNKGTVNRRLGGDLVALKNSS